MQIDDNQIYRIAAKTFQDGLESQLFGASTATNNTSNLSPNSIQEAYDLIQSFLTPIYYAVSPSLEQGNIYRIAKTKYSPEYIAFHPSNFDMVKSQLPNGYKLVPLKDAPVGNAFNKGVSGIVEW